MYHSIFYKFTKQPFKISFLNDKQFYSSLYKLPLKVATHTHRQISNPFLYRIFHSIHLCCPNFGFIRGGLDRRPRRRPASVWHCLLLLPAGRRKLGAVTIAGHATAAFLPTPHLTAAAEKLNGETERRRWIEG